MATRWVRKGNKLELVEIYWNDLLFATTKDPSEAWTEGKTLYAIEYNKKFGRYITRDSEGNIINSKGYEGKTEDGLNYEKRKILIDLLTWREKSDLPQN